VGATEAGSVAEQYFDAFNRRDFERGAGLVAEECEWLHVATGEVFRGPAGYKESASRWTRAFPDATVEIARVVASGTDLVVEVIARGRHDGTLLTWAGEIPPTGRSSELRLCYAMTVEHGKITDARIYYDTGTMLRELGIVSDRLISFGLRIVRLRYALARSLGRRRRHA
jgi:steroid delta-isomerase-like uncharacterized protein